MSSARLYRVNIRYPGNHTRDTRASEQRGISPPRPSRRLGGEQGDPSIPTTTSFSIFDSPPMTPSSLTKCVIAHKGDLEVQRETRRASHPLPADNLPPPPQAPLTSQQNAHATTPSRPRRSGRRSRTKRLVPVSYSSRRRKRDPTHEIVSTGTVRPSTTTTEGVEPKAPVTNPDARQPRYGRRGRGQHRDSSHLGRLQAEVPRHSSATTSRGSAHCFVAEGGLRLYTKFLGEGRKAWENGDERALPSNLGDTAPCMTPAHASRP